jgi:hypothetical protein
MTPWYLAELDDENEPSPFEFIVVLFLLILSAVFIYTKCH